MVFLVPPPLDVPEIFYRQAWSAALLPANTRGPDRTILVTAARVFYAYSGRGGAWVLGAIDAKTGRRLWNVTMSASGEPRLVAGGGHLLVAGPGDVWQVDPRNGRVVWHVWTSDEGVGPFVVGDCLVAETSWGRLQAIDLRSHRMRWTLQYPVEIGGSDRHKLSCVSDGMLWAAASDGDVIRVSLADGRLVYARPFTGGPLRSIVPLRGKIALCSDEATEAWRIENGALVWRIPGRFPGQPFYAATLDQLWTVRSGDGRLLRFRASDGERVGETFSISSHDVPSKIARSGGGYVIVTLDRQTYFDALGRVTGESRRFLPPRTTLVEGKDVFGENYDGALTRLKPLVIALPSDPAQEARRLATKTKLSFEDAVQLGNLGHAAVPTILAALDRSDRPYESVLKADLLRVADAQDTAAVLLLVGDDVLFDEPQGPPNPFREWLATKADPDWLALRLLPLLRTNADPEAQARLVDLMVRSRRPEIVAELRARLLASWSSPIVKDAVYHGLAASGSLEATDAILRLRREDPFPTWSGPAPRAPATETARVLSTVFEARMRFAGLTVSSLNLGYGPGVEPFAVRGWPGQLKVVGTPPLSWLRPSIDAAPPFLTFDPLDLDGTMVRFAVGGTEATARIGMSLTPGNSDEFEATLKKIRGAWFVVSLKNTRENGFDDGSF